MSDKENRYEILKSAYEFLNRQISSFESMVELESAEYNLLRDIYLYTFYVTVAVDWAYMS